MAAPAYFPQRDAKKNSTKSARRILCQRCSTLASVDQKHSRTLVFSVFLYFCWPIIQAP